MYKVWEVAGFHCWLQAIYGFRGSESKLLQCAFEQQYPNAGTYLLPANYRSGSNITEMADVIRSFE